MGVDQRIYRRDLRCSNLRKRKEPMIRIQQLTLSPGHSREELVCRAAGILKIRKDQIEALSIVKQSIDARKKPEILFSYVVDVTLRQLDEKKCVARCKNPRVSMETKVPYRFPATGKNPLPERPVIIGTGPAGLFCGYLLAKHGYRPILIERGKRVDERSKDVEAFWAGGALDPESNVSFGEGGAGTFSDGKLNTLVKDPLGRSREALSIFVAHGAQPQILYEAKPHIGTDVLTGVIGRMRDQIEAWGGQVRFGLRADGFRIKEGRIEGIFLSDGSFQTCHDVVLAIGHSARDTFLWLEKAGVAMEAKSFAVGLRVEHPQKMIDSLQYGVSPRSKFLPPAPYKVTARAQDGRGVYSFCMCPGGYVVNASSEPGRLAVNGMSYSGRDGKNANSAIIVSVTPQDFGQEGPLAGIEFQRRLEEKAFAAAKGEVPVQRYGDFSPYATAGRIPDGFEPCIRGKWRYADLSAVLPQNVKIALEEGMAQFGRILAGFDDKNAILSGVESRTSSPVRILRDETLQSNIRGLYPCGEGAGYAGGIMSAAMDGMRVAETIAAKYAPFHAQA